MIRYNVWHDPIIQKPTCNLRGRPYGLEDCSCYLQVSVCHHYDENLSVFRSRRWAKGVGRNNWSAQTLRAFSSAFAFQPLVNTHASCKVTYHLLDFIDMGSAKISFHILSSILRSPERVRRWFTVQRLDADGFALLTPPPASSRWVQWKGNKLAVWNIVWNQRDKSLISQLDPKNMVMSAICHKKNCQSFHHHSIGQKQRLEVPLRL